jgi:hypothetical protein
MAVTMVHEGTHVMQEKSEDQLRYTPAGLASSFILNGGQMPDIQTPSRQHILAGEREAYTNQIYMAAVMDPKL